MTGTKPPAVPGKAEKKSNVGALRTFRVLRALKTVAVVPGQYCMLHHLMEIDVLLISLGRLSAYLKCSSLLCIVIGIQKSL
jgi:hypothetical protein